MGSTFAAAAFRTGHRVVIFDAMTYAGDTRRLAERGVAHQLVVGDVVDRRAVVAAITKFQPSAIVHYAAESHVTRAANDPDLARRTNVVGTRTVLEVAAELDVPHTIFISSAEVYGERLVGHANESDDADTPQVATYAASKREGDAMARQFARRMPVAIVRPTIAFGPYQHPEKALPRWICSAIEGSPLEIWGDGSPVRQWVAVEDIAEAVLRVGECRSEGIFNVGSLHGPEITNVDIARRVLSLARGDPALLRMVPGENRRNERRFSVTSDRIAGLGWSPGDFDRQLAETVRWYRSNRRWWAPLRQAAESLYGGSTTPHATPSLRLAMGKDGHVE